MPGLSMWILQSLATELQSSVIHPTLQVDALFGVVFVAHHFGMDAGQIEVGGRVFAAPRDAVSYTHLTLPTTPYV